MDDSKTPSPRNLNKKYNWVGLVPDILEFLASNLNFTYELELSRDGTWGYYDQSTGEWSGIIKDVVDGVADIGVAPLTVNYDRTKVVDFLLPIHSDKSTFVVSQKLAFNNSFLATLKTESWRMVGMFVFILGLSLSAVVRISKDKRADGFRLQQCLIYASGALCGFKAKGWFITPVTFSARFVSRRFNLNIDSKYF